MTIADDNQKPKPAKKLAKSLDTIAALRIAMEQRLLEEQRQAEEQIKAAAAAPEPKAPDTPPPENPKAENKNGNDKKHDPAEWGRMMFDIAERSQKLIQGYLERSKQNPVQLPTLDPARLTEAFSHLLQRIANDPERFLNAQITLWQGYTKIWQTALERMQGKTVLPVITPAPSDKRFKDSEWQSNWVFDFIKQSYLLTAEWTRGFTHQETEGLDPKQARKVEFYTRQMIDAMSPSNFWLTNPEVLRTTFESKGENLVKGLENLIGDLERGGGQLQISMADMSTLKVGENLATTPGKVVYQNSLIQLIQYAPQTENVLSTPLLLVPPWINKYYILDLQKKNSFIGYLVAQGYTVFCVSWVNPDKRHAAVNFEDYMTDGMMAAMREVRTATGAEDVNILGYCIGGTLLATTLAYLNAAPKPPQDLPKVKSATYLVTMIDFSEPGDLGVFIDEDQVEAIEAKMAPKGYLEASSMATTFNLLRSNDLIWSFVVNNYMLGKDPFPFDILFWNCDSTNLPAAMQSFYLRNMYIDNKLVIPKQMVMKNVPIDVRGITTPSFLLSTKDDHIAPWKSTYAATQMYNAPIKFVLSGSGHIAGIINPPSAKKYSYWTNDALPQKPEDWLKDAKPHEGSWWPEWLKWLQAFAGDKVPARAIKDGIEDAPGSYVRVRAI